MYWVWAAAADVSFSSVVYVLGANPPQNVMEGFVRRIWGKLGVDEVALAGKGIFFIRLAAFEFELKVLNGGLVFFYSKPVIMKPWDENVSMTKDLVRKIPIWVKLMGLDVKY